MCIYCGMNCAIFCMGSCREQSRKPLRGGAAQSRCCSVFNKTIFENSPNCCVYTVYVSYRADVWLVERKKPGFQWRSRRLMLRFFSFAFPHTYIQNMLPYVSPDWFKPLAVDGCLNKDLDPLIMLIWTGTSFYKGANKQQTLAQIVADGCTDSPTVLHGWSMLYVKIMCVTWDS